MSVVLILQPLRGGNAHSRDGPKRVNTNQRLVSGRASGFPTLFLGHGMSKLEQRLLTSLLPCSGLWTLDIKLLLCILFERAFPFTHGLTLWSYTGCARFPQRAAEASLGALTPWLGHSETREGGDLWAIRGYFLRGTVRESRVPQSSPSPQKKWAKDDPKWVDGF